ncbi:MAG: DNA-protecting protein DprA, partial [Clostridia bacterium]|nr:DNA-protecting protein DprA [Clostridia bacterium]
MEKNNIKKINVYDEEYPEKLKSIYDKPLVLYAEGNIELLKEKSIAIVGSRECSKYGMNVSEKLSYNLAKENICIISGLAKGIDRYAHIGALRAGGKTIAVLGNGLDTIYPYENKDLYELILKNNGLIITEYILGT